MTTAKGASSFSALALKVLPDIQVMQNGQVFPRFCYTKTKDAAKGGIFEDSVEVPEGYILEDNILDEALTAYQQNYKNQDIIKDDIFFYVYGLLHSKGYREKYANDLVKDLPRIPMAPDFWAFSEAGKKLCDLHAFYENLDGYNLQEISTPSFDTSNDELYRFKKLKWAAKDTKTELVINDYLTLRGIPEKAHEYIVNGNSGIWWVMNRYEIKVNKESGITNDPNNLFENPRDFIKLIEQVVQVSVETVDIVDGLPTDFEPTTG